MILAAGLFAAKALAAEILPLTIESGPVTYTITSAVLVSHFENIEPPEETEYLVIRKCRRQARECFQSRGWCLGQAFLFELQDGPLSFLAELARPA